MQPVCMHPRYNSKIRNVGISLLSFFYLGRAQAGAGSLHPYPQRGIFRVQGSGEWEEDLGNVGEDHKCMQPASLPPERWSLRFGL